MIDSTSGNDMGKKFAKLGDLRGRKEMVVKGTGTGTDTVTKEAVCSSSTPGGRGGLSLSVVPVR